MGDKITFNRDRQPIAEAVISRIEKPGESQCAGTDRFLNRWKVYWTPESFKKVGAKTAQGTKYHPDEKYNGRIPEIHYLPLTAIERQHFDFRPEVLTVSDDVAQNMDFSEPVDVTAFRYGYDNDDLKPAVRLADGHHRYAAALQTGRKHLPVAVTARNAKGAKLNALVAMSQEIEAHASADKQAAGPVTVSPSGKFKDFVLSVERAKSYIGTPMVTVKAKKDGTPIGYVTFAIYGEGTLDPMSLDITEAYRRQGLATAMYMFAEKKTKMKIVPSSAQTPDGKSFWAQPDRPFGRTAATEITVKEEKGSGGVTRLKYYDGSKLIGSARLMGETIGDIEVHQGARRQGYGKLIVQDCVKRGGRSGFAGSDAGGELFKACGFTETSPGRYQLTTKTAAGPAGFIEKLATFPLGTILHITLGTSFLQRGIQIAKADDAWHQVENFAVRAEKVVGQLGPVADLAALDIQGAEELYDGIKPGDRVTNVIQMDCLPEGSTLIYTSPLPDQLPRTYQKVGMRWAADGPELASMHFDHQLAAGKMVWHGTSKTAAESPVAQKEILVVVHPGSACSSADFNYGSRSIARAEREGLILEFNGWQGGVIIIDGELSEELVDYPELKSALDGLVSRAKASGLTSERHFGQDPDQTRVIRKVVKEQGWTPEDVRFVCTGAWAYGGTQGCVGSVYGTLKRMKFRAEISDMALTGEDKLAKWGAAEHNVAATKQIPVTKSPTFQAWFSGSKVVDGGNRPLMVFHGTGKDFDVFSHDVTGTNTKDLTAHFGFFFTEDPNFASQFVPRDEHWQFLPGGHIKPCYLSIKNPRIFSMDEWNDYFTSLYPDRAAQKGRQVVDPYSVRTQLESEGFDGIMLKKNNDKSTRYTKDRRVTWVAFRSGQIKSATGNNGDFDPDKISITAATDDKVAKSDLDRIGDMLVPLYDNTGKLKGTSVIRDTPESALVHSYTILRRKRKPEDKQMAAWILQWGNSLHDQREQQKQDYESKWIERLQNVVFQRATGDGVYVIVVDSLTDAKYVQVLRDGKKIGELTTATHNIDGKVYTGISSIEIDPKYRGMGLGKEMYKILLAHISTAGIASHLPNRSNKKQVPKIYQSFGGHIEGDWAFIPKTSAKKNPAFDSWFAGSKVVDKRGRPLKVYHGTRFDFDVFDAAKSGTNTSHPTTRLGFFFTPDPDVTQLFQKIGPDKFYLPGAHVKVCYLSIKNPLVISADDFYKLCPSPAEREDPNWITSREDVLRQFTEKLQSHDGMQILADPKEKKNQWSEYRADTWVAFSANQIKSAIGNNGEFDPANESITAAINAGTKTYWHGTALKFDELQPNEYGIIWAGDKRTATDYAKSDAQFRSVTDPSARMRLIPVRLTSDAKVIDLRDKQDPIVAEFYTKVSPAKQEDTSHLQLEGRNLWALPFLREKGVDAVLVTDDAKNKMGAHLSLGIINPDAIM